MTQQMGEVPESLVSFRRKAFPVVADGPVLALFAEHPFLRKTDARRRVAGASRAESSAPASQLASESLQALLAHFWKVVDPQVIPYAATPSHPGLLCLVRPDGKLFEVVRSSQKYLKFLDQSLLGDLIGRVAKIVSTGRRFGRCR